MRTSFAKRKIVEWCKKSIYQHLFRKYGKKTSLCCCGKITSIPQFGYHQPSKKSYYKKKFKKYLKPWKKNKGFKNHKKYFKKKKPWNKEYNQYKKPQKKCKE